MFRPAGALIDFDFRTFAHDRSAPLGSDERLYLAEILKALCERAGRHLEGEVRRKFEVLADPVLANRCLDDLDLTATFIDRLAWGRKPS